MIREGRKLPDNIVEKLQELLRIISTDADVVALYAFGSLAHGTLKPLSDLDFGVLLDRKLNKKERFDKYLDLIGKFTKLLQTDEIDLILLNDSPMRFAVNIMDTGEVLFERDRVQLINFYEKNTKLFLDFKYFLDDYNSAFLEGVRYNG